MEAEPDPTVQRRQLSMELRKVRIRAKMKQAEVAEAMDWSPSKLIRIESGRVGISTNDLRQLLAYYSVTDNQQVEDLLELAKSGRKTSVYEQHADVLAPGFVQYLAYEASAAVIYHYDLVVISGLLQTEEYARAILEQVAEVGPEFATKAWAVREHRQELHDRQHPPQMQFIMDEAVVRRRVGQEAHVMQRQLERLREYTAKPHISLQILPFAQGAHPGMEGNFTLLEFDNPNLRDVVHLESHGELTIRDNIEGIARYGDRFKKLQSLALSPEESEALLDQLIGEMSSVDSSSAG